MALYFMEKGSVSVKPKGGGSSIDITVESVSGNRETSRAELEIGGVPGMEKLSLDRSNGLVKLIGGVEVSVGPKPTSGSRVTVYYPNSYLIVEGNV